MPAIHVSHLISKKREAEARRKLMCRNLNKKHALDERTLNHRSNNVFCKKHEMLAKSNKMWKSVDCSIDYQNPISRPRAERSVKISSSLPVNDDDFGSKQSVVADLIKLEGQGFQISRKEQRKIKRNSTSYDSTLTQNESFTSNTSISPSDFRLSTTLTPVVDLRSKSHGSIKEEQELCDPRCILNERYPRKVIRNASFANDKLNKNTTEVKKMIPSIMVSKCSIAWEQNDPSDNNNQISRQVKRMSDLSIEEEEQEQETENDETRQDCKTLENRITNRALDQEKTRSAKYGEKIETRSKISELRRKNTGSGNECKIM